MLVNNLYFIAETDTGTGADEVLGSEIIDPKEMLIKTKKVKNFPQRFVTVILLSFIFPFQG